MDKIKAGLLDERTYALQMEKMYAVMSSAVLNGGKSFAGCIFNHTVDKDYRGKNPEQDLRDVAAAHRLGDDAVGMMTAVDVATMCVARAEAGRTGVTAYVTVGYSNAWSAGLQPEGGAAPGGPGTINIAVLIDGHLTDPAMINGIITATEAKTRALVDAGIKLPGGEQVTGTTTDAVVIAASMQGEFHEYAGTGSKVGRLIGQTVYEAMLAGIEKYKLSH
jgi:iron complex transport system ATP-binding protein